MSHQHFCEVAGHEWVCESTDCVCICHIQMEAGDHSQCPIELCACSEHPYGLAADAHNDGLRMEIPADKVEISMHRKEPSAARELHRPEKHFYGIVEELFC